MHNLCNTFQQLAIDTWKLLQESRSASYQVKEETITDINMLRLKRMHSHQVRTITFTKHEEGLNGADWEWWFHNILVAK